MLKNFTIQSTVLQSIPINVTDNLKQLISNCNLALSKIVISQIDSTSYVGTCLNTPFLFFFPLNANFTQTILDLSTYNMSMPINNMILNPILEI